MIRLFVQKPIIWGSWTIAILAIPSLVFADGQADLNRLKPRFTAQIKACNYRQAEQTALEMKRIAEGPLRWNSTGLAYALAKLAVSYKHQGRYAEAAPLYERVLTIRKRAHPAIHREVAIALNDLADVYGELGRYDEAEPLYVQGLKIEETLYGPNSLEAATPLNDLAWLYGLQGRHAEAERYHNRSLVIREKNLPPNHPKTLITLNNLGDLYSSQGRYAEAEQLLKRVLAARQESLPPEHPDLALSLNNLAVLYSRQGRYAEAEAPSKRALAIRVNTLGPKHPHVASDLNNLASLYGSRGRFAEAEALSKRALAIRVNTLGPKHPNVATSLNNLARLYQSQGRYAEAESFDRRALIISQEALPASHPDVIMTINNLATVLLDLGRYEEAEPLRKQTFELIRKKVPPDHPSAASHLDFLACLYAEMGRHDEAEEMHTQALAIREKVLPKDHPSIASTLHNLAWLYDELGRYAEARRLLDRAISIRDRIGQAPGDRSRNYSFRARLAWKDQRPKEALADLRKAIELAESQRADFGGAAHERGRSFERLAHVFEQMVAWQIELGNAQETLDAIERSRARILLDQLDTRGIDLLATLPETEARRLNQRERIAQTRVASLTKQLELLQERKDLSADQRHTEREQLLAQLRLAQYVYVAAYADIRNASPAYRLAVSRDRAPVALEILQQWVTEQEGLLLEYFFGRKAGYLLVVSTGSPPRLETLAVNERQAGVLGIEAGPLTATRLRQALMAKDGAGLIESLRSATDVERAQEAAVASASFWNMLIPPAVRDSIVDGKYQRLIVLPDGLLAQLPFETLVVQTGDDPKYLLDVAPPILYAPSATILINLAEREEERPTQNRPPILTVGDCQYDQPSAVAEDNLLAQLAPGNRYAGIGGHLKPLPYTDQEMRWVAKVFGDKQMPVAWLRREMATERIVRHNISGRQIVHFATHGLVDQAYGNLFGSLALTPGPQPNKPADDGFLTLAETYELNLRGCELAILSACETNVGPTQRGEGIWALSRGFLVAGSRRVVASNWLVDDEAAASLISYFCSIIAKAEAAGEKPDYAEALWKAKRWVRNHPDHPEWKHPYYWGTFVLVGPN